MDLSEIKHSDEWTLFLDRDGVLNRKIPGGYVKHPDELEILEGVFTAMKGLEEVFRRIIVVTNQQGIGKEIMTTEELEIVHMRLITEIDWNRGRIDKIYHCPELVEKNAPCRKPNPGMAHSAKADFPEIKFTKSIMVGDSNSDMEFGRQLGMMTVFISAEEHDQANTDLTCKSLLVFYQMLRKALI